MFKKTSDRMVECNCHDCSTMVRVLDAKFTNGGTFCSYNCQEVAANNQPLAREPDENWLEEGQTQLS